MSKKLIISLSVVVGIIAVILILFWTLFALSTVEVDYKTTTHNLNISDEEIIEAGDFSYGACVLFDGKSKYVENIENHVAENENFAYLEVVNIETVFPNRYIIHVAEREEVFAVEHGEQYLVCDDDFRVLKIEENFESEKNNPILLKNLSILNENEIRVGDFLNIGQTGMFDFYNAMLANNRTLTEQKGFVKSLTLGTVHVDITDRDFDTVNIETFSGREFVINNIDFALENKIQLLFALDAGLLNQINSDGYLVDSNGEIVYDRVLGENGEYINGDAWTYERLLNSYVLIDNFILNDYQETKPTDIYYNLVKK